MIERIKITVRVERHGAEILDMSTRPENRFAPRTIHIKQHMGDNCVIFILESSGISPRNVWTIRRTVDDFIFCLRLSINVLSTLERKALPR